MAPKDETYEGWSNRETWAVALHLNNTQWMYNHWCALLANIKKRNKKHDVWTEEEFVRFTFETEIKEQVEEWLSSVYVPVRERTDNPDIVLMAQDVGSLWRVNWREIALSIIEEDKIS